MNFLLALPAKIITAISDEYNNARIPLPFFLCIVLFLALPSAYAQNVTVISPNGGENITAGIAFNITWTGSGNDHYKVGYSTNASSPCTGSPGISGEEPGWIFICHQSDCSSPKNVSLNINSTTVRIKVTGHDSAHNAISVDCSDNFFTVASVPSAPENLTARAINTTAINLSWNPQKSYELVTKYLIFRNGDNIANTTDNNTLSYLDSGLNASTTYNYSIKASNPIGESAFSNNVSATTLSNAPNITLNSPANFFNSNSTNITFNCSATGNNALVNITLYGNWSGGWHANETKNLTGVANSTTFTKTISQDGVYVWNCLAYDNASNSSFATLNHTFTIDTINPVVNLEGPENNSVWNKSHEVNFTYNVTDANAISSCSLIINGAINQTNFTIERSTTQSFTQFLSNGTHNWGISCNDSAGNVGSSGTYIVIVPDFSPEVALNSPVNYFNSTSSTVNFSCSADDDLGLVNISLYHNITGNFSLNQTFNITGKSNSSNFTLSNVPDGDYIWNCLAYDTSGNASFATANRTFKVDTTPPKGVTNLKAQEVGQSHILWSWTNPSDKDFNHTEIYKNGVFITVLSSSISSYNMTGLSSNTEYTISIRTADLYGNVNKTYVNATSTTKKSSSTTAGEGGGTSGGTTTTATSEDKTSKIFGTVLPNTEKKMEIAKENIPVTEIKFKSNKTLKNVKITVKSLDKLPSNTESPKQKVYSYFNITAENLNSSVIKEAKVKFEVTKSWLTSNNFSSKDVFLAKYSNNGWNKLPTTISEEKSTSVVYESALSSFSIFAILAEKEESKKKEEVENKKPIADFSYNPANPRVNQTIKFDASFSRDEDGEIVRYLWNFDGVEMEGKVINFSFITEGKKTIKLTVFDNNNATSTITKEITILGAKKPKKSGSTKLILTVITIFIIISMVASFFLWKYLSKKEKEQSKFEFDFEEKPQFDEFDKIEDDVT